MSEEPKIVFIRKDIPATAKIIEELGDIVTADEVAQIYEHAFQEQIKDPSYPLTVICGNHSDPLHEHMQNNDRYTARQIRF
jgi:hypothetical protein